jgi:hypothetical protein
VLGQSEFLTQGEHPSLGSQSSFWAQALALQTFPPVLLVEVELAEEELDVLLLLVLPLLLLVVVVETLVEPPPPPPFDGQPVPTVIMIAATRDESIIETRVCRVLSILFI